MKMMAKAKMAAVCMVIATAAVGVSSVWAQGQPSTRPTQGVAAQTQPTGRPWLGISMESVEVPEMRQIATSFGYTEEAGLIVHYVYPNSPANGSLRQGDILTEANGEKLTEAQILMDHVVLAGVGGKLALTVFRGRKVQEVEVTVGAAPASAAKVGSAGK